MREAMFDSEIDAPGLNVCYDDGSGTVNLRHCGNEESDGASAEDEDGTTWCYLGAAGGVDADAQWFYESAEGEGYRVGEPIMPC
jgi:hypothetical protein